MNASSQTEISTPQRVETRVKPRAAAAYDYLKLLLLEGELGPGRKLSVVELTEQLNCSRVPIMEAMKRLAGEGFIDIVPQVGCKVVSPALNDVQDFFVLFAAVEGTVTAFAAERRTETDVREFKAVCQRIDAALAEAGSPSAHDPIYRRLNIEFHSAIHGIARSPVSTAVAASLWDRSDFYIKLAFGSLYFSSAVKRAHRAIRKSIISGEPDAARLAIANHLTNVGSGVVSAMKNQQLHSNN